MLVDEGKLLSANSGVLNYRFLFVSSTLEKLKTISYRNENISSVLFSWFLGERRKIVWARVRNTLFAFVSSAERDLTIKNINVPCLSSLFSFRTFSFGISSSYSLRQIHFNFPLSLIVSRSLYLFPSTSFSTLKHWKAFWKLTVVLTRKLSSGCWKDFLNPMNAEHEFVSFDKIIADLFFNWRKVIELK